MNEYLAALTKFTIEINYFNRKSIVESNYINKEKRTKIFYETIVTFMGMK